MAAKKFLPELISATQLTKKNVPATRQSFGKRIAEYYELELIQEGSGVIVTSSPRSGVRGFTRMLPPPLTSSFGE